MAASGAIVKQKEWAARFASDFVVKVSYEHLDTDDASAIAKAISKSTTLEDFSFDFGTIDSAAFPILVASFPRCASLQQLGFWRNNIGNGDVAVLASVLPQCEALKVLDLRSNSIGEDGAFALSLVLPSCRALRSLNLWGNDIGNQGAVALAKALEQGSKIDSLFLNYCNIGDEGAVALASAFPLCPSLRNLDLYNNHIGDIGAKAIVKSVIAHKWLKVPFLDDNNLLSLEWRRACNHLNGAIRHVHTRTCVFSMLSIHLQDSFHVPRGLVRTLLFDMLRVGKLRGIARC